jgi:hypothetical protein
MIKTTDLDLAHQKKYTEFSDVIKGVLHGKLASHDTIVKFNTDIEDISKLKTQFTAINNPADPDADADETGE